MRESPFQSIRRVIAQSISVKLALVICLLVGSLIACAGFVLTQIAQDVLRKNVQHSQQEIARQAAGEVSLFVARPVELLTVAAQLIGRGHLEASAQETALVEMSLHYPMFKEIFSLNNEGEEIASSNPGHPARHWSGDEAFQAALKGQRYISPVRIGEDHLPYVRAALPYWQMGKVAGILLAEVNLRGIWDIVDKIHIGETGILFLISGDGLVVAHPNRKFVLRNVNIQEHPALRRLTQGPDASVEFQTKSGKRYLASYMPVHAVIPLGIIVQMEAAEAYQLVRWMKSLIALVFCFSLLISAAVSFFLSRRLVRPVKSLQYWSKKIALGDFDYQVEPKSSDEIGRLFITFKRMSERLKSAREKERLAALGEVASSISHKLKNSLVSLKTFAQILPQRKQNEHFMQRFEQKFSSTVEHLEKIFVNLSQMASSNAACREPLDFSSILRALKDHYEEIMERLRIDFRLETEPDLPVFLGDRDPLMELFSNLIQNAVQAMPEGGTLTLKTCYLPDSSLIRVTLEDTGPGIPPEYVKNIFKPFFTTKHGGMGLGLSISKKIAEDHQGSLTLLHHDERGCRFQILFPVLTQAALENPSASLRGSSGSPYV